VIGVAVTTFQRPSVLESSLAAWTQYLPKGATLVVHDDASDPPASGATQRSETNRGVAASKNACIAALVDAGCDHLFLVDDDCWPTHPSWWKPYVEDELPHLMMCWGSHRLVKTSGKHTYWRWPRGVMLYAERRVVDTVGGMRLEFGRWGGEHVEWSKRIRAAGLTPYPFMDVASSRHYWHAKDRHGRRESTVPESERPSSTDQLAMLARFDGTKEFVEFR
jgi:hypothetical protein